MKKEKKVKKTIKQKTKTRSKKLLKAALPAGLLAVSVILAVTAVSLSAAPEYTINIYRTISADDNINAPDIVKGVSVTKATNAEISLKWDSSPDVQGYSVYISSGENGSFALCKNLSADETSCKLEGLEQMQDYRIYVAAKADGYESKNNEILDAHTGINKSEISSIISDEDGAVRLSWKANKCAERYRIEYKKKDSEKYPEENGLNLYGTDQSEAVVYGLEPTEEYTFRVRSFGSCKKEKVQNISHEKTVEVAQQKPHLSYGIDPDKPMVALTFDDGPGGGPSDRILDTLEKYNAKATFFMVGYNAEQYPENVRRKAELGMEIGNHTWDHVYYGDDVTKKSIKKASDKIKEITGEKAISFRSTGGITTDQIIEECKYEHMPLYLWTIDTEDWKIRNSKHIVDSVMKNVKDGDIILMHEIYGATADAVEKIVPQLQKKGFQLVTCHDLVIAKTGHAPEEGIQYRTVSDT